MTRFPSVTLLVTHYNRSKSLERLLKVMRELGCEFGAVVVSDDGSQKEQLERLAMFQAQYPFQLVTTPSNRGLGHNLNKGQDAVQTDYVLYVQEDFCPTAKFPAALVDALAIAADRPEIDLIRFFAHYAYPYRRPLRAGYSEMVFSLAQLRSEGFFAYSDTPHLRRRNFFERFGRYAEGVPAIKCEKAMVMSFLQAGGKGLQYDGIRDLFFHENSVEEPSTQNYSAFFKIKEKIPEPLFDLVWKAKLTAQYLFKSYRS